MLSTESYQQVIRKFLQSLQDGTLKPNDKIYSEHQLARILSIPRAQVREVYSALSILGVLYSQQGKGTFLGAGNLQQNTEILYLMTLAAGPDLKDAIDVRCMLDLGSAPAVVSNCTPDDIAQLRSYAGRMQQSTDLQTLAELDMAFHSRLVKASGNTLLHCLFQIVSGYIPRTSLLGWGSKRQGIFEIGIRQHAEIVDCLEQRDAPRLKQLLQEHYEVIHQALEDMNG